jgi:hypothetical protein
LESSPSLTAAAPVQTPKKEQQLFFSSFKTTFNMGYHTAKDGKYILMDTGTLGRIKTIVDYY